MIAPERPWVVAVLLVSSLTGCTRTKNNSPEPAPSASSSPPAPSSAPASSVSGAPSASAAPLPSAPPSGGVGSWESIDALKGCSSHSRELDPNLAHGTLSIAARGKEFAVNRFLRTGTRGEGQLAFGGYDGQARSVAPSHGLGKARYYPVWTFPRKEDWVVFWFDGKGLVFTRAGWSPTASKIGRFQAIPIEEAERVALLNTSNDGPLLGIAPLGVEPSSQLGLFTFVPGESLAEEVKAIGATHQAVQPLNPAVVAAPNRYFLVWEDKGEAGKAVVMTSFDGSGRELGSQRVLSTPGRNARQPAVALLDGSPVFAWVEDEQGKEIIAVQHFDTNLNPRRAAQRVDAGVRPVLHPTRSGVALVFLRRGADPKLAHPAVVHLTAGETLARRGLLLSPADHPKDFVEESPAVALTEDDWLGVVYTFSSGMRSQLRTLKLDCLNLP